MAGLLWLFRSLTCLLDQASTFCCFLSSSGWWPLHRSQETRGQSWTIKKNSSFLRKKLLFQMTEPLHKHNAFLPSSWRYSLWFVWTSFNRLSGQALKTMKTMVMQFIREVVISFFWVTSPTGLLNEASWRRQRTPAHWKGQRSKPWFKCLQKLIVFRGCGLRHSPTQAR